MWLLPQNQPPPFRQISLALDLGSYMKALFIFYSFLSLRCFACEIEVPVDVTFEIYEKHEKNGLGNLMILAPLKYEGMSLSGVQLRSGENHIPIMKYVSEPEFPGKALFELQLTSEFLRESKFLISYTTDPVKSEGGTVEFMPCLHTQEIRVKI